MKGNSPRDGARAIAVLVTGCPPVEPTPTVRPTLEMVAEGFASPVGMAFSEDGSGRLFIVDQVGKVRILKPDGEKLPTPFLDIASKIVELNTDFDERGLSIPKGPSRRMDERS